MAATTEKTWDEQRSKRARVATLQDQMKRSGMGALMLGGGIGVRYLLGVPVPSARIFVPAEGEPIGFIRQRDIEYVRPHHAAVRLALYEQDVSDDCGGLDRDGRMACALADLMEQHGAAGERLGVEFAARQVQELIDGGVPGLHFYVLNKSQATSQVLNSVTFKR